MRLLFRRLSGRQARRAVERLHQRPIGHLPDLQLAIAPEAEPIVVGDQVMIGFDPQRLEKMLQS